MVSGAAQPGQLRAEDPRSRTPGQDSTRRRMILGGNVTNYDVLLSSLAEWLNRLPALASSRPQPSFPARELDNLPTRLWKDVRS